MRPEGVLVEAVHDAGALDAADARQIGAVRQEGVDQRATRVARGRVYRHARGLVDDDQVGVFVDDGEVDGLRASGRAVPGRG